MKIDCIGCLHGYTPKLERGDLLIITGDLTARDTKDDYVKFMKWLDSVAFDYKEVIIVAGNHDNLVQTHGKEILSTFCEYLCDSGTEFEGLKIWGSPWSRTFEGMNPHCKAFTYDKEEDIDSKFSLIPEDTDILITHSPPFTIYDMTESGEQVGSTTLMAHLMKRVKPKLHVFSHIHEAYGHSKYWDRTIFANISHVNERYRPVNKPLRIVLE